MEELCWRHVDWVHLLTGSLFRAECCSKLDLLCHREEIQLCTFSSRLSWVFTTSCCFHQIWPTIQCLQRCQTLCVRTNPAEMCRKWNWTSVGFKEIKSVQTSGSHPHIVSALEGLSWRWGSYQSIHTCSSSPLLRGSIRYSLLLTHHPALFLVADGGILLSQGLIFCLTLISFPLIKWCQTPTQTYTVIIWHLYSRGSFLSYIPA